MDQKSKGGHEGDTSTRQPIIQWRYDHSDTSGSSTEFALGEEVMFCPSDLQSSFSEKTSPVIQSPESLVLSEGELGSELFRDGILEGAVHVDEQEISLLNRSSEDICSAEVNPVTYENSTLSSPRVSFVMDSSTSLPTATTQHNSILFPLSGKERAETGAAINKTKGVLDAESISYGLLQSDGEGSRVATRPNFVCGNRCFPPLEGFMCLRVKLMCSFGGKIVPRPHDGKLRYVGGETRIIAVNRNILYAELMYKLTESYGVSLTVKYQLPDEDLDALVSVSSDDDLQNMMEEHDKLEACGRSLRLRLFLFSADEYDNCQVQNTHEDGCEHSDQEYVDAINGFRQQSFANPFEKGLTGSAQQLEERIVSDNVSIMHSGYSLEGTQPTKECISSTMHQLAAWPLSSTQTFPKLPFEPSSAPTSPPMASRQTCVRQRPIAGDRSLQFLQDQLAKVTVHGCDPMSSEAGFSDLGQIGSRGFSPRQRQQYFPSDSQRASCLPRQLAFEVESARAEQITGDAIVSLMESQDKSSNVFEQYIDDAIIGNGQTHSRHDAQQLHEMLVRQLGFCPLYQQQHHHYQYNLDTQQQQYTWQPPGDPQGNIERVEAVQHCFSDIVSQTHVAQHPSLQASYFHPHHGVRQQGGQRLTYHENISYGTFLHRPVSSNAMGMGTHISSAPTYPVAAAPSSPTIALCDLHAQHQVQAKRTFSDSHIGQPYGRGIHYGDQTSKNLPTSRLPQVLGNLASSYEWTARHQHQHPIQLGASEAGFQELAGNFSQPVYERFPSSQYHFSDSLSSPNSPQYGDFFAPMVEQIKIQCQSACLERDTEASMQNPFPPHQANSRMDYHNQPRQPSEQVPEEYDKSRDCIGTDIQRNRDTDDATISCSQGVICRQPLYSDEDLGKALEDRKCVQRDDTFYCNCARESFDPSTPLAIGGTAAVSFPKNEWLENSAGIVPVTLYSSGGDLDSGHVSLGVIDNGLHIAPSPTRPRFGDEPDWFTRKAASRFAADFDLEKPFIAEPQMQPYLPLAMSEAPSGHYLLAEQKPSGIGVLKADSHQSTSVTCAESGMQTYSPLVTSQAPSGHYVWAEQKPSGFGVLKADSDFSTSVTCAESGMQPYLPLVASQTPSGHYALAEQKSSGLGALKTDSHSFGSVTCALNVLGDFSGARNPVKLLNGAHILEEASICGEMHQGSIHVQEKHSSTLASFSEGLVDSIATPDVQPNCVNTFLNGHLCCTLGHEKSLDNSDGSTSPAFTAIATSHPSFQMVHAFQPMAVNNSEKHQALTMSNLPIYDQSPVGSVNATASRDFSLITDEMQPSPPLDSDEGTSLGRMSLTGHLAEAMICSVLNSCGRATNHEAKTSSQQITEDFGSHERKERGERDSKSTTNQIESISVPPTVKDMEMPITLVDHFSRENVNVETVSEAKAKERSSSKERKNETLGKQGDCDLDGVGEKGVNPCAAEVEAISRGLQTIKNAYLEEIRELGSGTFGTVYHGKWRGSDVAIKRIKASCFTGPLSEKERLISDFWKEACTLGQLHHPNVVAFYGVVSDGPDGTLATVTEYMVNGSLKQVLHKKDRTIDRRKRLFIAMDAAFGMEYLHSKNVVHFDLKCENLLVNMRDPHRPICKVGDFGLSKVKHHTLVSGGVRGTLPWMAPELLSGNNSMVTEKIDVFSFGIVMWELLTGEEPYAKMHCGAIIGGIVNNTLRPSVPSWCDPAWRSLMERCWSGDPGNRPTFSEVACELRAIAASMNLK